MVDATGTEERCPVCGGELEFRQQGSTQGLFCKACDWNVVTTFIPEIEVDPTSYKVFVVNGDPANVQQVRAVSQTSGGNFLIARELLQQAKPLVFEGKAPRVREALGILRQAGLEVEIEPSYKY